MANDHPAARLSAFDCAIIRGAFRRSALEEGMPEKDRRRFALLLAREFTELEEIDTDILDWIVAR